MSLSTVGSREIDLVSAFRRVILAGLSTEGVFIMKSIARFLLGRRRRGDGDCGFGCAV